ISINLTAAFHRHQEADLLIPVLCSLYAWKPFFWEQERVGMLVPLLATPFEHPLTNLLVQNGITIFTGLLSLVGIAWYLLRERFAFAVGAVGAILFLATVPIAEQFRIFNCALPYLTPLALGLVAAPLATPRDGWQSVRAVGQLALKNDVRGLV